MEQSIQVATDGELFTYKLDFMNYVSLIYIFLH